MQTEPTTHPSSAGEHAAREPIPAPESADRAVDAARPPAPAPEQLTAEHIAPPPLPKPRPPLQSAAVPVVARPSNDNVVDPKMLFPRADKHLASYIRDYLSSDLIDDSLRLAIDEDASQQAGIRICLKGDKIPGNHALAAEQLIAALKHHAAFAPLFHDSKTRPHFKDDPSQTEMVHVHVNHLTTAQYHGLVKHLATQAVAQTVASATEHPLHPAAAVAQEAQTAAEHAIHAEGASHEGVVQPAPQLAASR